MCGCVCGVCVDRSNQFYMHVKVDTLFNFVRFSLLSNASLEYTVFAVCYDITVGKYFLVMGGCVAKCLYCHCLPLAAKERKWPRRRVLMRGLFRKSLYLFK